MKTFAGICRGGPYDGKQLAHTRPTYRCTILPPIKFCRPNEIKPAERIMEHWGEYRYVLGNWIWREEKGRPVEGAA